MASAAVKRSLGKRKAACTKSKNAGGGASNPLINAVGGRICASSASFLRKDGDRGRSTSVPPVGVPRDPCLKKTTNELLQQIGRMVVRKPGDVNWCDLAVQTTAFHVLRNFRTPPNVH